MKEPDIEDGKKIIDNLMDWLQIERTESNKNTPERIAKMYLEVFDGLYNDPPQVSVFRSPEGYVCVTDISFSSFCEHHFLPFMGTCGVVYHSDGKNVIGLSKIARIVRYYSKKPQLQERLTNEIASYIMNLKDLNPRGVYVKISATHTCMTIRGIKAINSVTNTATMLGDIDKEEAENLLKTNYYFNGK